MPATYVTPDRSYAREGPRRNRTKKGEAKKQNIRLVSFGGSLDLTAGCLTFKTAQDVHRVVDQADMCYVHVV